MSLNLIEKALQFAKEGRLEFLSLNLGITEPLTPKARRNVQYLMVREWLMKGCREATRLVLDHYKRPPVYSILVQATEAIFDYGKRPEILAYYNDLLDRIIGTH